MGIKLVVMPYSEVCMHMRVAGKPMLTRPVGHNMCQLYTPNGRIFSFPITMGEAGRRRG